MFYELSQLAFADLMRARARLVMTAGGVLVGTTAVILLIALTVGLQRAAEASIGNDASLTEIEVYPNYGFMYSVSGPGGGGGGGGGGDQTTEIPQLTVAAVREFWRIPGVAAVIPIVRLQGGEINAGRLTGYADIQGVDPALLPYMGLTAQSGQISLNRGEMILGARLGEYFSDPKVSGENYQPVTVDLFETEFKIKLYQYTGDSPATRMVRGNPVAKLATSSRYDYAMLMNVQDVLVYNEWITGKKPDPKTFTYDQVIIRSTSRETTNSVSEAVRKMGYQSGGMGEFLNQLNNFFTTMRLALGGVGGVALLVAAFGVANTMTMAILERTREIGLMKALGATDRNVLTIFLVEAGLVGLAGGAAGVGLSFFLQNLINQAVASASGGGGQPGQPGGFVSFLPFDTSRIGGQLMVIPPELAVFALLLATVVGLGAGLYPALRAARLAPVIALKME